MKTKQIIKRARKFAKPFRVSKGKDFRLKDVDPGDTLEFIKEEDKPRAKEALANGILALAELQNKLYAQDRWGVLLIFQAMDAAGKDGAIKHVMSGVARNPCQIAATSEFLTAATTKKCWSFACTPNSWKNKSCRRGWWARRSGTSASRISATSSAI